MGCNCIDVSEHNGSIDWYSVKADGVDYALIRCGFGQDMESQDDGYFHENMREALNAGLKVGVYFYSYAKNGEMASGEADHCLRLIEPYRNQLSLPVFYDLEEDRCKENVYDIYTTFEARLKEAGYNVGCYACQYWYDTVLRPVAIDYCWVAKWGGNMPDWGIDIWQYTSTGSCAGIGGNVDCDEVVNTQMTALIEKPEPEPVPQKVVNITIEVDSPDDVTVNVDVKKT